MNNFARKPYVNTKLNSIDIFQNIFIYGGVGTGKTTFARDAIKKWQMQQAERHIQNKHEDMKRRAEENEVEYYHIEIIPTTYFTEDSIKSTFKLAEEPAKLDPGKEPYIPNWWVSDLTPDIKLYNEIDISEKIIFDRFNYLEMANGLKRCKLLVLDDVGSFEIMPANFNIYDSLIDWRIRASLPTIVISNKNIEELEKLIGTRAADRLQTFLAIDDLDIKGDSISWRIPQ